MIKLFSRAALVAFPADLRARLADEEVVVGALIGL
jgi:hypothetical protein